MGHRQVNDIELLFHHVITYMTNKGMPPTDVIDLQNGGKGIAWSTKKYYFDIELYPDKVEFFFSPKRSGVKCVTLRDDTIDTEDSEFNENLEYICESIGTP